MTKIKIEGGCHCGTVRFQAHIDENPEVVICNCSVCSMVGFQHIIIADDDFSLIQGQQALTTYQFGTKTAEHLFCSKCGVKSFYKPRSHPHGWSLNAHCLPLKKLGTPHYRTFDGQNWEQNIDSLKDDS